MDHHKLCCTELVYYAYEEYKNYLNLFPRYKKLAFGNTKYIIAPDDIFFLTKNMTIVYISELAKKKLNDKF